MKWARVQGCGLVPRPGRRVVSPNDLIPEVTRRSLPVAHAGSKMVVVVNPRTQQVLAHVPHEVLDVETRSKVDQMPDDSCPSGDYSALTLQPYFSRAVLRPHAEISVHYPGQKVGR